MRSNHAKDSQPHSAALDFAGSCLAVLDILLAICRPAAPTGTQPEPPKAGPDSLDDHYI
jgi:hypothetical protein